MRRTNVERSEAMRGALMAAARGLFVEKGYADTATPEIVAAACVTRGALYHHFADKKALFAAVVEGEARQVAEMIDRRTSGTGDARTALAEGASAYFDAMAVPGRTRLLLLDAPAVLGPAASRSIDEANAEAGLATGLAALMGGGEEDRAGIFAQLLSAAFDRAAIAIEAGGDREHYERAIAVLIDGLAVR